MDYTKAQKRLIILILGALSTVTPLSIDMYLPSFRQIAENLGSSSARVSLSLSSYFIGIALGQLVYGPLLDRFGRKKPLYIGMFIYIAASIACMLSVNVEQLIIFRFMQALGGCVAMVAATAMVRDFFPVEESAKIFSLLMLILGVSPLFAPTIGGLIIKYLSWHWVFIILAVLALLITLSVYFYLPDAHKPDTSISLHPRPIITNFWHIMRHPQFYTYAVAGAVSFSGLLAYVAGSPIIFLEYFKVTPTTYSLIFATLACGFIGSNQVNIFLCKKFRSDQIFPCAVIGQCIVSAIFVFGIYENIFGITGTVIMLFSYLFFVGLSSPNAGAMSLAPFTKNVGSASALMGFLQIGISSFISMMIGLLNATALLPIVALLASAAFLGMIIFFIGRRNIKTSIEVEVADPANLMH